MLPYNEFDRTRRWLQFIGARSEEERKRIALGDELLMKLNNWIDDYVLDEETKKVYSDWTDWILKEDAKEDGMEQERRTIAKNMLKKNMPLTDISELTGLSLEQVKELQNKNYAFKT